MDWYRLHTNIMRKIIQVFYFTTDCRFHWINLKMGTVSCVETLIIICKYTRRVQVRRVGFPLARIWEKHNFVKEGSSEGLFLSSVLYISRAKLLQGQNLLLSSTQRVANTFTPSCKNGGGGGWPGVSEACSKLENFTYGDIIWRDLYVFLMYRILDNGVPENCKYGRKKISYDAQVQGKFTKEKLKIWLLAIISEGNPHLKSKIGSTAFP